MKRYLSTLLLILFLLLLAAGQAWSHGGRYRGPGGAVPPEMRDPQDPPPAPPPPDTPPTTEPPVTPTPGGGPAPVTPRDGPSPVTPTPGQGGAPRTGGKASLGMDSWAFWYETNKAPLQNLKRAIYTRVGTSSPLHTMGVGGHTNQSAATHLTRAKVLSDVIPALLWALDPDNAGHQDTESAAYIALAKVSADPRHIELLQKGLEAKHPVTQESAALALGLLRRARKEEQFAAVELDRVRLFLFRVFENESLRARTRGFAALAIGLLGDQPAGSSRLEGARATCKRLFDLLARPYEHPDLPIALLVAVSLQPRDAVDDDQRKLLRDCVTRSRIGREKLPAFVSQFAALALGRIGDREQDAVFLQRTLSARRGTNAYVQRSAAIALGVLGQEATPGDRAKIASTLIGAFRRRKLRDASARNFAIISLARLVTADVAQARTEVMGRAKAGTQLMQVVQDGGYSQRPYGALALGLVCRAIGDESTVDLYGEFRAEALDVLRNGLASRRGDTHGRAAFAVALGLAGDEQSVQDLVAVVADEDLDPQLRGYAALGLGHIGQNSEAVLRPLRRTLKTRFSEDLRRTTATALGMLRDRRAVPLLLEELRRARSASTKGGVVLALARVGDERAVDPLVGILKNEREQDLTRALACAGLGLVGDLEWTPSLARLSTDMNYRAAGAMMAEVLSIL